MSAWGRIGGFFAVVLVGVAAVATPVSAIDLNNFTISSFDSQMTLGRNVDNRSTLKTTETIVAEFPDFDQNHGLERAIPKEYDGHTTSLQIQSVTDENGTARAYSTYDDNNGNLIVRMADMNKYVHGQQTYKLTYTQQDVTKFYNDTNVDEFYWDVNGTDWKVPIALLNFTLTLDNSLETLQRTTPKCYSGLSGANTACTLSQKENVITGNVSNLRPFAGMTVAFGFQSHTFAEYQPTLFERFMAFWAVVQAFSAVIVLVISVWLMVSFRRWKYRSRELKPIPVEYIPPRGHSLTIAAMAMPTQRAVPTAQLMDLAVQHYIVIRETQPKSGLRPAEYEIEIVRDLSGKKPEEIEQVKDMFGGILPRIGTKINLSTLKNDLQYTSRLMDNSQKLSKLVMTYGVFEKDARKKRQYRVWSAVMGVVAVLTLAIPSFVLALQLFVASFFISRLSDDGLKLRRYMLGLKHYISVAEVERLKFSQSPEGAAAIAQLDLSGTTEGAKTLRLYERLLPYAIIFGQEKQWAVELGRYYEQVGAQPDWYVGQTAFNAIAFGVAMNSFSQSMSSYAGGMNSNTGGSGGSGFSGGGGGGGGGGGV